jgi:endonuclease-3
MIAYGKILDVMLKEAEKRNAPVFTIRDFNGDDPFRSLIFSILSSRTKDPASLIAAKKLFSKYPSARRLAKAERKKVEKLIHNVGFYRQKAKYVIGAARMVVKDFNGKVPDDYDNLVKIPGVGRKVANVLLAYTFEEDRIPVDTHVHRISNRLGWVKTKKPEQTEEALMKLIPKRLWTKVNSAMVAYGQTVCLPRNPKCPECKIKKYCRYYKVVFGGK